MIRSFSICFISRMGWRKTGPSSFANSNSMPMGSRGSRISAKMMAASTSKLFNGLKRHLCCQFRILTHLQKGIFLPKGPVLLHIPTAWRMSQIGVYVVGFLRQAIRKGILIPFGLHPINSHLIPFSIIQSPQQLDEQSHSDACPPSRDIGSLLFNVCRTGNIEMDPRDLSPQIYSKRCHR